MGKDVILVVVLGEEEKLRYSLFAAFSTVNHGILLGRLAGLGMEGAEPCSCLASQCGVGGLPWRGSLDRLTQDLRPLGTIWRILGSWAVSLLAFWRGCKTKLFRSVIGMGWAAIPELTESRTYFQVSVCWLLCWLFRIILIVFVIIIN